MTLSELIYETLPICKVYIPSAQFSLLLELPDFLCSFVINAKHSNCEQQIPLWEVVFFLNWYRNTF